MEKLIRHCGSPDSDKGLNAFFPRLFLRDSTKSSGAKNRMEASVKTDGTREAAAGRRLLSAQPWGFASLSEQQVAPRKHSRIYALHLKCSQAKPSFFLYGRLCSRAEVVLFFFWSSLLLFLSPQNLVKSKLRLVWKKKKKRRDTYLHFLMLHRLFSRTSSCSLSVSLTSHSSWIATLKSGSSVTTTSKRRRFPAGRYIFIVSVINVT